MTEKSLSKGQRYAADPRRQRAHVNRAIRTTEAQLQSLGEGESAIKDYLNRNLHELLGKRARLARQGDHEPVMRLEPEESSGHGFVAPMMNTLTWLLVAGALALGFIFGSVRGYAQAENDRYELEGRP